MIAMTTETTTGHIANSGPAFISRVKKRPVRVTRRGTCGESVMFECGSVCVLGGGHTSGCDLVTSVPLSTPD